MRQRSRSRQSAGTAEDLLPVEIRRRRCERGLSREELARRTGYSRQYIGQLEQPSRGIPARPVVAAVDAALQAGGALVDLREAAIAARAERMSRRPDPEQEARRRINDLLDHRRSDTQLDRLDRLTAELIAVADSLPPAEVSARVMDHQAFVDRLMRTPMLPHQQFRLFMIAGHLAGLLALALLDMNEPAKASTCCLEAAVFTELTGHEGLRAWMLAVSGLVDAAARRDSEAAGQAGEPDRPVGPVISPPGRGETADEDSTFGPFASTSGPGTFMVTRRGPADPVSGGGGPRLRRGTDRHGTDRHGTDQRGTDRRAGDRHGDEMPEQSVMPSLPGNKRTSGLERQANLDELLIAPGGRATPPRLIALVKGRIARFATPAAQRANPPSGISQAFQPPV